MKCLPRARVGWLGVDEGSIIKECRASLCYDEDILKLMWLWLNNLEVILKPVNCTL